jgi:serine/threonine protein kinase
MDTARLVGEIIDQYRILSHIDRGGMADVYLAQDVNLQRNVAFKVMLDVLALDKQFVRRFRREARTVARLEHPNIVQVYSTGQTPLGQPYIAMQYIEGGSLRDKLSELAKRKKLLTTEQVLNIMRQIALALSMAHRVGIVHRDLKPSNVLVRPDGTPVLVDLGIAMVMDGPKLTQTGGLIGTLHYMSPEQVRGLKLDGRSDLYSLGIILYEMLAGVRPFAAKESIAVLHQHVYEEPPPLSKRRPDLSPQVLSIVEICLQKEPARRFQNAEEMVQAIDHALQSEGLHGPNPQATQVLTELHDSGLISRRQVVRPPTGERRRQLPVSVWVIVTFLALSVAVALLFILRPFNTQNPPMETAVAQISPQATAVSEIVVVEVTQTTAPMINTVVPETAVTQPTSTLLPTATASATASPTETLIPTVTPVPSQEPTPIPGPPVGQIVFTCFINGVDEICRINADGSGYTRLTNQNATDFYASYSPDNSQIIFSTRRNGRFEIYIMNADGTDQQPVNPNMGDTFAPEISPDGSKVVFAAAQDGNQDIWVMILETGELTRLTISPSDDQDPTWSPDGSQIAFASFREGDRAHFIMDADGANIQRVIADVADIGGRVDWSPDGQWLSFYAGSRGDQDIFLVRLDGSELRQLTTSSSNLAPSFSPDGQWLVFTSYRDSDGDGELFIIRTDGSDLQQLTSNNYTDWQPRWEP